MEFRIKVFISNCQGTGVDDVSSDYAENVNDFFFLDTKLPQNVSFSIIYKFNCVSWEINSSNSLEMSTKKEEKICRWQPLMWQSDFRWFFFVCFIKRQPAYISIMSITHWGIHYTYVSILKYANHLKCLNGK